MYDAEILYIVNEIINSLFGSKNKNVIIRLNHTSIIKAILLHCGIKQHHNDILRVLSDAKVLQLIVNKFSVYPLCLSGRKSIESTNKNTFNKLRSIRQCNWHSVSFNRVRSALTKNNKHFTNDNKEEIKRSKRVGKARSPGTKTHHPKRRNSWRFCKFNV